MQYHGHYRDPCFNTVLVQDLENERDDTREDENDTPSSIIDQMNQKPNDKPSSILVVSLKALESGVDSLRRIGIALQQSSAGTLTQRINAFDEKRNDGILEEIVYSRLKYQLAESSKEDGGQGAALSLCRQLATSGPLQA